MVFAIQYEYLYVSDRTLVNTGTVACVASTNWPSRNMVIDEMGDYRIVAFAPFKRCAFSSIIGHFRSFTPNASEIICKAVLWVMSVARIDAKSSDTMWVPSRLRHVI